MNQNQGQHIELASAEQYLERSPIPRPTPTDPQSKASNQGMTRRYKSRSNISNNIPWNLQNPKRSYRTQDSKIFTDQHKLNRTHNQSPWPTTRMSSKIKRKRELPADNASSARAEEFARGRRPNPSWGRERGWVWATSETTKREESRNDVWPKAVDQWRRLEWVARF